MRQLVRVVCWVLLLAVIGIVVWMASLISGGNTEAFLTWNSLYDYIAVGAVVFSCLLLAATAVPTRKGAPVVIVVLGLVLLATGLYGHYGFQFLSGDLLAPIPPMKQLRPNAAQTVLGFHYVCPTLGGQVAFGDGSVKFVDKDQFATLRRADNPDYPPEFVSPIKVPPTEEPGEGSDPRGGESKLSLVQERLRHSNNLKRMAVDHLRFQPRDGIRAPLKPEDFGTYRGMPDELQNAISDGTYVWYFGWEPTVSYATEKALALWYDFASWACGYVAGFGGGALLAGLVLAMKRSNPAPATGSEPGSEPV